MASGYQLDDESRDASGSLSPQRRRDPAAAAGETLRRLVPTVSVITAAYNPGDYLREAIRSVVAQTFTEWELIVVDDGSDEDLAWVAMVDPRVSLVRQRNQGISAARNRGIAVSRARFIAFLDADDRWRPTKLERQVELLRAGSVFCHTAFDLIDSEGSRIGPGWGGKTSYLDILAGRNRILVSSSIVDKAVLQRFGMFDPLVGRAQDADLWLRLARSCEFSYLPTVEVEYRRHAGNATRNYWGGMQTWRVLYAREARLNSSRNDTAVAQAIRKGKRRNWQRYADQAIREARLAAHERRPFSAVRHLVRATQLSPRIVQRSCVSFVRRRLGR